jgi:hypothetical protein
MSTEKVVSVLTDKQILEFAERMGSWVFRPAFVSLVREIERTVLEAAKEAK